MNSSWQQRRGLLHAWVVARPPPSHMGGPGWLRSCREVRGCSNSIAAMTAVEYGGAGASVRSGFGGGTVAARSIPHQGPASSLPACPKGG